MCINSTDHIQNYANSDLYKSQNMDSNRKKLIFTVFVLIAYSDNHMKNKIS